MWTKLYFPKLFGFIEERNMKKILSCILFALLVLPIGASDYFCKRKVIKKVESHVCVVLGYFKDDYGTYTVKTGAGAVLKDNHVITACHVINDKYVPLLQAYVITKGMAQGDHWAKATVVAQGHEFPKSDDYAVLKVDEDLGLKGLKIARKPLKLLQKVLFAGSPDGNAFFVRGGYVSMFKYFVARSGDEFALLKWYAFPSPTVYIAYPGDSGGIITNTKGHIQSIMFWGRRNRAYAHGNPIGELRKFLFVNQLEWLER